MKKMMALILVVAMCFTNLACVGSEKSYDDIEDYNIIYDNVEKVNKTFSKDQRVDTLLKFDEYLYYSYLLLFPREAPQGLNEFRYMWKQGIIDIDNYAIYFSYKLSAEDYHILKNNLKDFTVTYKQQVNKPVYTEDVFVHPTYIMAWSQESEELGFCEYIMLDDENCTVINVYKLFYTLQEVQDIANYDILPKNGDYSSVASILPEQTVSYAKSIGYSVYAFEDENGELFVPKMEELQYDTLFLEAAVSQKMLSEVNYGK